MANMSYCRFENTLADLKDCHESMEDVDDLSDSEKKARRRMIDLCVAIAQEYGDEEK